MKTELNLGEALLFSTRKSLWSFLPDFLLLSVFGFMLCLIGIPTQFVATFVFFVCVYQILFLINHRVYITSERVITETGIFSNEIVETLIQRIVDVKTKNGIIGRLLKYGTIEIETSDNRKMALSEISDVKKIKGFIDQANGRYAI